MELIESTDLNRATSAAKAARKEMEHTLLDRLHAMLALPEIKVVSFDCFDTLVKRMAHRPVDIFEDIGDELRTRGLLPRYIDNKRFKDWRIRAEMEARRKVSQTGSEEVGLAQIYNELEHLAGNPLNIKEFLKVELEVEKRNMFLSKNMLDVVRSAKKIGKKTILVSDTYYSSSELKFITGLGDRKIIDHYYISSEYGTGKGGDLFDKVIAQEGVSPHEILHVGDNYRADIECAGHRGIRTLLVPNGTSHFWDIVDKEKRLPTLERRYWGQSGIGSWHGRMIATRSLRTKLDAPDAETSYFAFGYEVFGPIFFSYLKWVQAIMDDMGRPAIRGLLREGGFLAALYKIIDPEANVGLLGLSRKLANQIAFAHPTKEAFRAALSVRRSEPVENYLSKLGLVVGDVPDTYKDIKVGFDETTENLFDYILSNKSLLDRVRAHGEVASRKFVEYVDSAIDQSTREVVFLDLGWGASIQKRISSHDAFGGKKVLGLYLALHNGAFADIADHKAAGYLVNGFEHGDIEGTILTYVEILEQACTPDIGSTIGYSGGCSIHGDLLVSEQQRKQIADIQAGIISYVEIANEVYPDPDVDALREVAMRILARFTYSPTDSEREMFRNWHHDDSVIDSADKLTPGYLDEIQPYMSAEQLLRGNFLYYYWPQGTAGFGTRNSDYFNLLQFGTADMAARGKAKAFAAVASVDSTGGVNAVEVALNGDGLFYAHLLCSDQTSQALVAVARCAGSFSIEQIFAYINMNGTRTVQRLDPQLIQVLDRERRILLFHYDGRILTPSVAETVVFAIPLPMRDGQIVENIGLGCAGVANVTRQPLDKAPDVRVHLDLFAGQSEFGEDVLSTGIPAVGGIEFAGWAFEANSSARAEAVLLHVEFVDESEGSDEHLMYYADVVRREDVSKTVGRMIDFNIGFSARIPTGDLDKRAFKIFMKFKFTGAWCVKPLCDGRTFIVNSGVMYML